MGGNVIRTTSAAGAAVLSLALVSLAAPPAGHASVASRLHPGAVEIGFAGALSSVAGSTRVTVAARAGAFVGAPAGLAGFEIELGYNHERALDGVDVEGALSWQRPVVGGVIYPLVSIGGGLREERLGSFSQARYPMGFTLGLRALAGPRAAVRVEYRYRRILNDPVADYTEHQALTGISLVFRNRDHPTEGEKEVP